jgi:hypothetical protein
MKRARAGRRLATVTAELAVTVLTVRRLGINQRRSKWQLALTALMVPLMTAGVLIGLGSGAVSAGACVSWTGAQPPVPGASSTLDGAAVVSSCSAWAVGYYYNGTAQQTLVDHWNGSSWVQQTSPDPGGTAEPNELLGVSAISTKNAWAAGFYYNGTTDRTMIEHWNGSNWTQQPSPNVGTSTNELQAVKATSASNAWAVGYYSNGTTVLTLILHWNGSTWKRVSSPNAGTADQLYSIAATSAKDAWAVGYYETGTSVKTLILHWNGSTWKHVSSPNPGGSASINLLLGVAATSTKDAWAVGFNLNSVNYQTEILHWNGSTWKHVTSPDPSTTENILYAVKATSSSNVWAVGFYLTGGQEHTLVTHWNGHSWAKVASPTMGSNYSVLSAVGASSSSSIWAVGQYYNGSSDQGLAVHCC